ncbi:sigma 54-interacting transcriptional regulator [Anaerovorax sp. IOR16]|uniref:sigma 54-interacting transcriptional regulator n=1 Tax=Anaerovorax sp. IOR16 TaxID=2773458 RepID=UPI0019D2B35D|nr:sigma 54-interacting transcriptional regulator [Anaerovorax sp. IOR16]
MKKIYLMFNDTKQASVCRKLYNNLISVFSDYVSIEICFMEHLITNPSLSIMDGDIYLVLYQNRIYSLRNYVTSLDKVIVMNRTIQKKYLNSILEIPEGNNVLIVNDEEKSTLQTANTLFQLGINHINLIPYEQSEAEKGFYNEIKIAITPDEECYVPKHIKKIINIQDRFIDASTFINIINKLKINNEHITRNLIKYMDTIVTTELGESKAYLTNHLKEEMLNRSIHNSNEAVMITDFNYYIVYTNKRASTILSDMDENLLKESLEKQSCGDSFFNHCGTNYLMEKSKIRILDQVAGYSFIFKTEQEIKNMELNLKAQYIKNGLTAKYKFNDIIHQSKAMNKCISLAKKAATADFTVLIHGESGTGKELIAQSIHNFSDRHAGPFVAINCAALPETLLESELFGYEKGAFTGARTTGKLGLFEQANTGTVFLDEIGDMPITLQTRLLRVLQERQIMRIGSDRVIDIDVRVIAATNKNLHEAIVQGTFRKDLYYRLNILPISVPPLQQRESDILLIFNHFLSNSALSLNDEQTSLIQKYSWPGNVRELENTANYFKIMEELPEHFYSKQCTKPTISHSDDPVYYILNIIDKNTNTTHGIGRSSIIFELKNHGIKISDNKGRKILSDLAKKGLIEISNGRCGNRITEKGKSLLSIPN